jgi:Nucleotidyl transferase of unknown function (DUF2204)
LSELLPTHAAAHDVDLPISAVVAGGAVAVYKYGSRAATRDVDFFTDDGEKNEAIEDAAEKVAEQLGWNKKGLWINASLSAVVGNHDPDEEDLVYNNAIADDDNIIYQSTNLILYHAPPQWMLLRKLIRLSTAQQWQLDWDDSLIFLHDMVQAEGAWTKEQIKDCFGMGSDGLTDDVLNQLKVRPSSFFNYKF